MACRCQERREAIKRAVKAKSVSQAVQSARFVVRTTAEDARRAFVRKAGRK